MVTYCLIHLSMYTKCFSVSLVKFESFYMYMYIWIYIHTHVYALKYIVNLVNKQHAIKMVNIDDEVQ
jgi:hypothetical protein